MKALLYCTKAKPYLVYGTEMEEDQNYHDKYCLTRGYNKEDVDRIWGSLNGKIVAECEIDKVEEINLGRLDLLEEMCKKSCLSHKQLYEYLADFRIEYNCMFYKQGYALHLSNVKVFDEPKELAEYCTLENEQYAYLDWQGYHSQLREKELKKAHQNMMVVYEKNITINHLGDFPNYKYILISIKPEWLCKILNGEKTIEVRKQILKCLKEMIE